jgi:hypothetical protein
LFAESALQWGWTAIVCNDSSDAEHHVVSSSFQLAFVDLEGPEGLGFRTLVNQLAAERHVLLVVCGNPDDHEEEIWARQLGVWFYLVGEQCPSGIGLLCRDARSIEQQRNAKAIHPVESKPGNWWERTTWNS